MSFLGTEKWTPKYFTGTVHGCPVAINLQSISLYKQSVAYMTQTTTLFKETTQRAQQWTRVCTKAPAMILTIPKLQP
jgi:hypothetical protein